MSDFTTPALACEFVSYRSSFLGEECGAPATHRADEDDLCREHWVYTTSAVRTCSLCNHPLYEDYHIFVQEHTCSSWDMGYECMHFEATEYCACEDNAKEAFEVADRTPVEPVHAKPADWYCEGCEEDSFCSDAEAEFCDQCTRENEYRYGRMGYDC